MTIDEAKRSLADAVRVLGVYGTLTELARIVRASPTHDKLREQIAKSIEKSRDAA